MKELIIDGEGAILGRLASYCAKQALQGKKIVVLNAEKVVITGRRKNILENYHQKRQRVGNIQRGPSYSRQPEKILKRAIRGMLPDHRAGRGKEAFKKIMCHKGIPEEYKEVKKIKSGKEKNTSYINITELSKNI